MEQTDWVRPDIVRFEGVSFVTHPAQSQDLLDHQTYLAELATETKKEPVWSSASSKPGP